MADLGVWTVDGDAPQSVRSTRIDLEEHLEDWIVANPSLLAAGLRIVGRQVRFRSGRLDLLAVDEPDRWVVIELKRGRIDRAALAQALDYASWIAQMDSEDLRTLLQPRLAELGDADELSNALSDVLDREDGARKVDVLLAGVGVDDRLERIVAHLGGYGVPISIVSFEVFEPEGGPRLLIREVTEEQSGRRAERGDFQRLLHAVLERVGPGQWTTYGALAEAIGSSARAVARHIARCSDEACRTGYRVMTVNGTVALGFYFQDPSDKRKPVEVLQAEGVTFDDHGRANPQSRLDVSALRGVDSG